MKYALELQDELFDLFRNDNTICQLVGIVDSSDLKDCMNRIRRGIQPVATANDSPSLFFAYYVVPSYGINTKNYMANTGIIEFDIYFKHRGQMVKLFKAINAVLKKNYEDMVLVAEGNNESPVTGLNSYMFRVEPLVNS